MRIISGTYKGKRLMAPKKLPVRPTTDMAKEGLFNILNNSYYFSEIEVLDLFAGTGNISYEFCSRGTQKIISVDSHSACVHYINKTSEELKFPIITIKSDVYSYLEKVQQKADIIFADPPYIFDLPKLEELVLLVFKNELLSENGVFIIEHSKHITIDSLPNFSSSRRYGGSVFSFFKL